MSMHPFRIHETFYRVSLHSILKSKASVNARSCGMFTDLHPALAQSRTFTFAETPCFDRIPLQFERDNDGYQYNLLSIVGGAGLQSRLKGFSTWNFCERWIDSDFDIGVNDSNEKGGWLSKFWKFKILMKDIANIDICHTLDLRMKYLFKKD